MTHRFTAIADALPTRLARAGVASMAVAVMHRGDTIWEHAAGWADRARLVPATPHTPYALASVTKPLTATALMLLVQRGLVDLDRPISDYLGDAPLRARTGRVQDATVRRVASHSAGLPTHCRFYYADESPRPPAMAETIRRYGKIMLPPGEQYCYSNLGYGLLDHIISRVSGSEYRYFMRRDLFHPLGMARASVGLAPELAPYAAARYNPGGEPLPDYDFDHRGGSAVWCSAHDLLLFARQHLRQPRPVQDSILTAASIDMMQGPVVAIDARRHYGIGWAIDADSFGYRAVEHRGSMGGVSTILRLLPDESLAVAVLSNGQTDLHVAVAHEIIGAILPDYAAARERFEANRPPPPAPVSFATPPELSGPWVGAVETYAGDINLRLDFQPDGDVHVHLGDQLETLISGAAFAGGALAGDFAGDLSLDDTSGHRRLHLELRLRDGVLAGPLTAFAFPADEGGRMRNATSFWACLRR